MSRITRLAAAAILIPLLALAIAYARFASDGMTPLMRAADGGDTARLAQELRQGAAAHAEVPPRESFFAFLAYSLGAEGRLRREHYTALHFAAYRHHLDAVQMLLDRGATLARTGDGETPLNSALHRKGGSDVVALLVARGVEMTQAEAVEAAGRFAQDGHVPGIVALRDRGFDVLAESVRPHPLTVAAAAGQREMVQYILGTGANAAAVGEGMRTPERVALDSGHADIAALVTGGRPTRQAANHRLKSAILAGDSSGALAAVRDGADVNEPYDHETIAINAAVTADMPEPVILAMLERSTLTPAMRRHLIAGAARLGYARVWDRLAPTRADLEQWTLLGPVRTGRTEMVRRVLAAGWKFRDRREENFILASAAEDRRYEIVELLLEHGADPRTVDDDGKTVIERAQQRGDTAMARLLLQPRSP